MIYDGNVSLREALLNKTLNELDWSEWNHRLDLVSYIESFNNTEGFIYANGRYYTRKNNLFEGNLVDAIDIKSPSLFIHTVFDMILTQAGFTWSGSISENEDFLNRLTTVSKGHNREVISLNANGGQDYNEDLQDSYIKDDQSNDFVDENVLDSYSSTGGNNTLVISGTFNDQVSDAVRFEIHINGNAIAQFDLTNYDGTESINQSFNFTTQQNDLVELVVLGFAQDVGNTTFIVQYNYDLNIKVDYTPITEKYIDIDFADIVGEEKQLSFVKDIMQKYGLLFQKRSGQNHIDFVFINDLFTDRNNALNWSEKFSEVLEEEYTPPYNQFNYANYLYDEEVEPFANGTLEINNETLSFSGDLFTSIFKASNNILFPQNPNTQLFVSNHWEVTEDEGNQVIESTTDGLRFFKLIYRDEEHDYQFSDDQNLQTFTGNVPTLFFDEQCSYDHYLEEYYSILKVAFEKYLMVTATFKLSLFDIYKIDLLKLRYISHLGHYFYVNKISNYKPDRPTKVELIRVSNG